jgi:hypothetical protein
VIVQSWRAKFWKKEDISILILKFLKTRGGARVDLVHVGVPSYDQQGVKGRWQKFCWKPWRKYLASAKWVSRQLFPLPLARIAAVV